MRIEFPVYPGVVGGLILVLAFWAGLEPRPNPGAYPSRSEAGGLAVGAEYQGRGITVKSSSWLTDDYLAVEVGIFPGPEWNGTISAGSFLLRINGETALRKPATPGTVAGALRNRGLNPARGVEASGGLGNAGIIFGRPRQTTGRFPGDPDARTPQRPPQAPDGRPIEQEPTKTEAEAVLEYALPEGAVKGPAAGFVYYYFPGKKKLRTLELVFEGRSLRLL